MKTYPNLILITGLVIFSIACKKEYSVYTNNTKSDTVKVRTQKAEVNYTLPEIASAGIVSSVSERKMSFKIGGVIENIFVSEGQQIRTGQLLATLNSREIDAQVKKAIEQVEKLKRDLKRVENLLKDQVTTLENVQDLHTALKIAESDLEIAKYNQKHASIISPVNGKVLMKISEEGEVIAPGSPVLLLSEGSISNRIFKISVSDKQVVFLTEGDEATVELDALKGVQFKGKVSQIAENPNPATLTYDVEIQLNSLNQPLKNGFFGIARIQPSTKVELMGLPVSAVISARDKKVGFYIIEKGKAKMVFAEAQNIDQDQVLVLKNGEFNSQSDIIVASNRSIAPNQMVSVINNWMK